MHTVLHPVPVLGADSFRPPTPVPAKAAPEVRSREEDMRLRKTAQDFESIFLSYMMKTMRATVPKISLPQGGLNNEFFTGLFDDEVSKLAAQGRGTGLADMIYEQLSRRHDALPDLSGFRHAPQIPVVKPLPGIGDI